MPQHVRKRQERGQRVVERAVQEDLLGVRTADATDGGVAQHPVRCGQRRFRNFLQARRRAGRGVRALREAPADEPQCLADVAVPEHQRLHRRPPRARSRPLTLAHSRTRRQFEKLENKRASPSPRRVVRANAATGLHRAENDTRARSTFRRARRGYRVSMQRVLRSPLTWIAVILLIAAAVALVLIYSGGGNGGGGGGY